MTTELQQPPTRLLEDRRRENVYKIDFDGDYVFMHQSAGGFSCCLMLDEIQCLKLAAAFTRGAELLAANAEQPS